MGAYVQQNRSLRVTTPVGEDVLFLNSFSGTDEISRPFRFEVEMVAENDRKVPFDAMLGEKVTVHLALAEEGSEHHFNGVCVRFAQAGRDKVFTTYRAELVPEFQLLARKTQSRIFQRMTAAEILKDVLKGVTVEWKLEGSYEKRDFCVQYRESDFNFASRLMEEEGVFYFFRHEDGKHTMVVADSSSAFPDLPEGKEVLFDELEGGQRDEDRVRSWVRSQEARAAKTLLWDHTFELPHKHLDAETQILDSVSAGRETHKLKVKGSDAWELFDWPGEYAQRFDGINRSGGDQSDDLQKIFQANRRTAEIRMDEEMALAVSAEGKSSVKYLAAGHGMTLKRHFSSDGDYVLASVTHQASYGADYRSGKEQLTYQNSFTCFPSSLPYRPKRVTPRPVVEGSQTAVVVGPKGEEIFTDKYGRVKVQFHWDRKGKNDEDSSCWVRVGQLAAGRRWGSSFWPRIGQEVIVDFLEGDPDEPIIIGTVFNADQMPPYLGQGPDSRHRNDNKVSGLKTNTTTGGKGFNELRFDDTKDKEQVFGHAERNLDVRVKNDAMESVGHDKHLTVGGGEGGGDFLALVHRNVHLKNEGDLVQHIGGDLRLRVGGDGGGGRVDLKFDSDRKVEVGGKEDLWVEESRRSRVGGADNIRVCGDRITCIEQNESLQVSGNRTESTAGTINSSCTDHDHSTRGRYRLDSQGEVSFSSDESVAIEAATSIYLKCGASSVTISPGGIWIDGVTVYINSGPGASVPVGSNRQELGDTPEEPLAPAEAAPSEPTAADDAKSGQKSS